MPNNYMWRQHCRCSRGIHRTMMMFFIVLVSMLLQSIGECQASGLNWGHHGASSSSSSSSSFASRASAFSGFFPSSKKPKDGRDSSMNHHHRSMAKRIRRSLRAIRDFFVQFVTGDVRRPGPRVVHHILYWVTAADAVHSVFLNEYTSPSGLWMVLPHLVAGPSASTERQHQHQHHQSLVPSVYSRLFYFAKLRPRLLYAIGALLRALQLCTPFRRVLDPTAGVGAGINLCALLAGSRWVKPLVLGWATTKWVSENKSPPCGE
jgi:hypothetical protein